MSNRSADSVRVGHVDEDDWDLYVGNAHEARGLSQSPWACPFTMDPRRPNPREYMLAQYRLWLLEQDVLVRQLPALRGMKLACWCHHEHPPPAILGGVSGDHPCHGDVIAELVDALPPDADGWLA